MDRANELKVFSGNANKQLARAIARGGIEPIQVRSPASPITRSASRSMRAFGDDVFIVQPTCAPVNDHLMELLIAIDAFRRASAAYAVIPTLAMPARIRRSRRGAISAKLSRADYRRRNTPRSDDGLHARRSQGFRFSVDHLRRADHGRPHDRMRACDTTLSSSPDVGGVSMARLPTASVPISPSCRADPGQMG